MNIETLQIFNHLYFETTLSLEKVLSILSREHGVKNREVQEHIASTFPKEVQKSRAIRLQNYSYQHPKKRTKWRHVNDEGYWMIGVPTWYKGPSNGSYVEEHKVVYCISNDISRVPAGYHIHHIDFDKLNNDPPNLQLLTPKEHGLIHSSTYLYCRR